MLKKVILGVGIGLLVAGLLAYAVVNYLNNPRRNTPLVYSNNALLLELWTDYKQKNLEEGSNRTLDKSQANITTSEGQSYTMLRAVWMDDQETFDKSWQFSKNNLQRSDKLLSWKFGARNDGTYGVLTDIGGNNTASDADVDTALALMMAYSRWNNDGYLYQAKEMIDSIWSQEVVQVAGRPVLTANNLEKNSTSSVVVNPSYFSPYAFKLFAKVDPRHDWTGLTDNSYDELTRISTSDLGSNPNSKLPPNWVKLNIISGEIIPNATADLTTDYGYDALRTPFRLALDYQWNKDGRAKAVLQNYNFLQDQFTKNGKLQAVYKHDGTVAANYETPAMYGGSIGYFLVVHPDTAKELYAKKLQTLYNPDTQKARADLSYYDDNWTWFGIALAQGALPNIAEDVN